ncbi:MAG: hypothetical protein ACI35V_02485 [Sphingobacterium composti]|uniref:hypothetical protein n=1 Tax=Sphingobacterium composti TaxID=363260 RepID=UPI00135B7CED|nr:hypothetical protein [Sphingobacterium composti Ten et al. 2007 non Yoo et al. 2007]
MKFSKSTYLHIFLVFIGLFVLNISNGQSPLKLGKVTSSAITEISGITPYTFKKGCFWVHNDSGDGANIYLIDSTASVKVKVEIEGVKAIDCEDITRFKYKGKKFLMLGDIGNNLRNREILSLYIIEEPNLDISNNSTMKVPLFKEIKYKYADKRRDAEALFVDPIDNQVYIISKRDLESTVFSFPLEMESNSTLVLDPKLTLPFTFTTAADISQDGNVIIAKNLTNVFFWERKSNERLIETLKRIPKNIPYLIEPQGEAICFDLEKRYFYTISERPFGLDSYLYKYDF